MKKLLFSLGAITAIVAPVAAVVSCNDDKKETALHAAAVKADAKFTDANITKLEDRLKDAGITISNKSEDIVFKQNKNPDRPGHFMVLFKNAKINDANTKVKTAKSANGYTLETDALHKDVNIDGAKQFKGTWGLTDGDLKDVTAIAYFWSTTPTGGATTNTQVKQEAYNGDASLALVTAGIDGNAATIHDITFTA